MKILLSPAKSLDFKSKLPTEKLTNFCFEEEAKHLNSILKNNTFVLQNNHFDVLGVRTSLGLEK